MAGAGVLGKGTFGGGIAEAPPGGAPEVAGGGVFGGGKGCDWTLT